MIDLSSLPDKKEQGIPPVHLWTPDFCGDIDIVIKANGDWIHQGEKIPRLAMVKMFSRILWFENEEHFLVTPVEKVRINVEDAPFLITKYEYIKQTDGLSYIVFFTHTDDRIVLGQGDCNLWLEQGKPYVSMRYGMKALLHRSVYYALVECGIEKEINNVPHLCVLSGESLFSLGRLDEDE